MFFLSIKLTSTEIHKQQFESTKNSREIKKKNKNDFFYKNLVSLETIIGKLNIRHLTLLSGTDFGSE